MDLEPVRSSAVTRATLGHADHKAFLESAALARGSVLLVDDTLAVVLALTKS